MKKTIYLFLIIPMLLFSETTDLTLLMNLISNMSNTVHSLQKERGASTGYVSSKNENFKIKLDKITLNSDEIKKRLLISLNKNFNQLNQYFTIIERDKLNTTFNELYLLRNDVSKLNINFSKTYSKYTQIIAYLLLNISDMSDRVENKELVDKLYSYSILLMYKESIGQKRAALSGLFSQKIFSEEVYEYFLTSDTQEKIYLKTFLHSADDKIKELYYKLTDNDFTLNIKNYENLALEKLAGKEISVDPVKWFEEVTKKIDKIQELEHKIFSDILVIVNKLNKESSISLTQEEKEWIKTHVVSVGVEQWNPVVFSNNGTDIDGIAGDFLKNIIKQTNLKVKIINDEWDKLLSEFKNKKLDLLPATYYTKQRATYGFYSSAYFKMKDYIYVQKDNSSIKTLKDLNTKKLAIVNDYGTIEKIRKKYPNIKLVFTKNIDESINKVLNGEVDALYEGQIVIEKKIATEFISGLKGIAQNSFSAPTLHLFSQKNEPILQSILQKGLDSISDKKKKELQKKWSPKISTKDSDKILDIAFHFDRPPYMFGKTSSKGIEADLVKEIFLSQGYKLNIHQMAKQNMEKILETNADFDGVASVSNIGDGMFYSDKYSLYEDFAITRKADNIKLNSIDDLAKHNFISWKNAYNDLGKTFYKYFNPIDGIYKSSYHDRTSQKDQHKLFFDKKIDVIVADKMIFKWYKLDFKNKEKYTFHKILPLASNSIMKFKSKKIRDIFNRGLKEIKKSGKYQEVVNFYLTQDIRPLLKYSNLIADISGRFIFAAQADELKKVLSEFFQHPDIAHIEVFDKATKQKFLSLYKEGNKLISDRDDNIYHHLSSIKKDIYFANKGNPLEVGKVEIFYKKSFDNKNGTLIPSLDSFTSLNKDDLKKIKRSYKKYGLNIQTIVLTKEEKNWIKEHPFVNFTGDPDWLPFEAFDSDGKYIGIVSEYLEKIETLIGVKFIQIATDSWADSVKLSESKTVDVLSETTDAQREHLIFTKPYITNDIVIVMDKEHNYVEGLNAIKNKKIALIKDYGYIKQIKLAYPEIDFLTVNSVKDGLNDVSTGKIDALVCTLALGSYTTTQMGLSNIKIVGKTKFSTSLGLGIRKDYTPLVGIINKAIDTITQEEHNEIFNHWIKQEYIEKVDYTLLYKVSGAAFVLILLFIFWNRKMAKEISKRKEIESKLQESSLHLSTLFDASPDSIAIVNENGMYVDCNKATLEIFGLLSKDNFLQMKPSDFSPKLQYNNELSSTLAHKVIAIALEKGTHRFEWIHKRIDTQESFDAEVILTSILLNNKPHIYAVVRDITETKDAQRELKETQDKQRLIIEKEVQELTSKQTKQLQEIERSNQLLNGRENKMVELKTEINEYASQLGITKPYIIVDGESEKIFDDVEIAKDINIKTLLDTHQLQLLMEEFYNFMNIPLAIIDLDGIVLVQSKWSRACTDFHRANSESCKRCIESDIDIGSNLIEGEDFSVYKCKNGLIDCASPIIVNGIHVANFFIGQFLIEEPDIEFFISQAKFFGYDEEDYISAIKDAVVISEEKLPHILRFLREVTEIITKLSNEKLNFKIQEEHMQKANIASLNLAEDAQKATKEIENYKNHLEDLVGERTDELNSQKDFVQTLLDSQEQLIITTNGKTMTSANKAFKDFYDVKNVDIFKSTYSADCICETFNTNAPNGYLQIEMNGEKWIDYIISRNNLGITQKAMITREEKDYIFSVTASILPGNNALKSAVFTNITELENQKKQIETILENILLPVIITSKATRNILYVNSFSIKKYEVSEKELLGRSVDFLYTKENQRSEIIEALNKDGNIQNLEQRYKTMSGEEFDGLLSLASIEYNGEEAYIGMVVDITQQKEREKEIAVIHKHTQDSIEYASLIQGALIPDSAIFNKFFSDFLTIWHPKDIVGGDIYLFEELRDKDECLLMVIDCTGHGVPGAFVTMLVKAIERQIVAKINSDKDIDVSPAWILSYFNKTMKKLLQQESEDSISNAGFDGGIIYYNKKEKILKFAGSETPLYYIEDDELKTIKGSRHSIGYKKSDIDFEFKEHTLPVKDGMQFYVSTDGYFDQNGGEKSFPFSKKRFTNTIKDIYKNSFADQKKLLLNTLSDYQGNEERNDDVTLLGLKI